MHYIILILSLRAPSAGALYPLEIYIAVNNVKDLNKGIHKYNPHQHVISLTKQGNVSKELMSAALGQSSISDGAIVMIIAAVFERVTVKYRSRGERYVYMEVGHAAQNINLQATALNLGTVVIGAFDDNKIKSVVGLPAQEKPICLMPVGKL